MDKVLVTLTVFFEDPFWVGVVERIAEKPFGFEDYIRSRAEGL